MIRTGKFACGLTLVVLCIVVFGRSNAASVGTFGIEHVREFKVRPDGSFDVTCIDGEMEVRTQSDIQAGRVCTHIQRHTGLWTLAEGGIENGMRMCDINVDVLTGKEKVLSLQAGFAAPCGGEVTKTEDCSGLICNINLLETFYTMDFTVNGFMTLTRLSDGFSARFSGRGGIGTTNNTTRIATMNGVDDILQVSNDNGVTWLPVCDDGFGQEEAAVACRAMGFSGVQSYDVSVRVTGSDRFGLDDLFCSGNESNLFECRHSPWGSENCGNYEHVQLVCN